ncbi:helix-turn-helix transcriptional regulator [Kineosporia sp. A_224]|uniref:helix-turn-helix domain-containing protein n=1 Tax=Kineosporia sp. A_224 TaxID=1962180 RepID=UPI000B4BC7F9|nr:helix-turn-helix transcriptional regulator [Kineosporia sp. A_224]
MTPAPKKPTRQRRKVSYQWRLREVMAEHKMYATTELVPLLAERGINLSASQVHRLVTSTPERLSLPILAALCDIFAVDAGQLIPTEATSVGVRKVAAGDLPSRTRQTGIGDLRPVRARIVSPEE